MKRISTVSLLVLALAMSCFAQTSKHASKKSATPAPDKAHLQKIWDAWATLDPDNAAKFYVSGPGTFFDIAPLKYGSWEEYDKGAKALLADYKSATFTVNDDAAIHSHGDLAWVTATVKFAMTQKSGKVGMGNMRWTAIFEDKDGKWSIVHEHVSVPMQ